MRTPRSEVLTSLKRATTQARRLPAVEDQSEFTPEILHAVAGFLLAYYGRIEGISVDPMAIADDLTVALDDYRR